MIALLTLAALAQSPGELLRPGLPSAPVGAPATSRWTVGLTPSLRFPDAETPGPMFDAGALVIVLLTEGDRARIQKGDSVGWVPTASLSDTPPPPPPLPPLELPKLP